MDRARLEIQLIKHEGRRRLPYKDTVGKLTIGIGRNLDDVGVRDDEMDLMLENDVDAVLEQVVRAFPWYPPLDNVRQNVILNMAFNMGIAGLQGFTQTLAAIARSDYEGAALHMLDSKWAKQVGGRAVELADMMRTGAWTP